ncbi:TadE family protein [Lachnospiraceae bacterium 54-53]
MRCFFALKGEKGQGMVEFALVFPVFFMILLLIMETGWLTYQQTVFDQSYQYSSWTLQASDLGDSDSLESCPSRAVYSGNAVSDPLITRIKEASFWGFIPENMVVNNAQAVLHNEEETFSVPGRTPSETVTAVSRTRYMDINADISYDIYPLTYLGRQIFGARITKEKKINCSRIVASQHRSE